MWGYWFGMNVAWWVFWVALFVLFFSFLTPVPRRGARLPSDPLEILQRRYAGGEITTAEYDERRAHLLHDTPRASADRNRTSAVPPRPPDQAENRTPH